MSISRNDPCPCGSGKKYKKCCLPGARIGGRAPTSRSRFRFEPGSYGGPGGGYIPSAICYEQFAPEQWREHFCLVDPNRLMDSEQEASAAAEADLNAAFEIKQQSGSDLELAEFLRSKGYVKVDGFRRAID